MTSGFEQAFDDHIKSLPSLEQILMKGPLVLATLDDTKTQTRRLRGLDRVNGCPSDWLPGICWHGRVQFQNGPSHHRSPCSFFLDCPYGSDGDHMWLRETWATGVINDYMTPSCIPMGTHIFYRASYDEEKDLGAGKWRPSIHMCRWMSRATLEITGIRIERVQDISDDDAIAEGVKIYQKEGQAPKYYAPGIAVMFNTPVAAFRALWVSINGKESWELNPWVWVVEYKRIKP